MLGNIRRLKKEVERYRRLIETSTDGIHIIDLQGKLRDWNEAFLKHLGYSEKDAENLKVADWDLQWDADALTKMMHELVSRPALFETKHKCKDGSVKSVEIYARGVVVDGESLIYASSRDITKRQERESLLEEQRQRLVQSSKLALLGEMAGGVAHEINTPLAIVSLNVEQMQDLLNSDGSLSKEEMNRRLQTVQKTISRIAKIIQGLRAVSRTGDFGPNESIYLHTLIEETVLLCQEKLRASKIRLDIRCAPNICIHCRVVEISQVILNLLNNSCDAISSLEGPWIDIQAEIVAGNRVLIRITDSGPGIPKELASKIMQPFFTTKEVGKGTGLGLSISRGIVESHGGRLHLVDNVPHTCFEVELPMSRPTKPTL